MYVLLIDTFIIMIMIMYINFLNITFSIVTCHSIPWPWPWPMTMISMACIAGLRSMMNKLKVDVINSFYSGKASAKTAGSIKLRVVLKVYRVWRDAYIASAIIFMVMRKISPVFCIFVSFERGIMTNIIIIINDQFNFKGMAIAYSPCTFAQNLDPHVMMHVLMCVIDGNISIHKPYTDNCDGLSIEVNIVHCN